MIRNAVERASAVAASDAKHEALPVEEECAGPRGRLVNLDVGYVDYHKAVLASFKPGAYKVYVGRGLYVDPAAHYEKGRFEPFPSVFLDFRERRYDGELLAIRAPYKRGLREGGARPPHPAST
jgi:hypothetical protein